MKNIILRYTSVFCLLVIISCNKSKDPTPDSQTNISGTGNGGSGSGGTGTGKSSSTSTITYYNASFTSLNITVNGVTKTIAAGGYVQFVDSPNTAVTGSATTSGKTSSGTIVGSTVSWILADTFPAFGNLNSNLNIGNDYFFLKIKNTSSKSLTKLYVNYGLTSQTLDNITIGNDGQTYNLGYYKASINSNVRGENDTTYWSWNTMSLPFTSNQSFTAIAN